MGVTEEMIPHLVAHSMTDPKCYDTQTAHRRGMEQLFWMQCRLVEENKIYCIYCYK